MKLPSGDLHRWSFYRPLLELQVLGTSAPTVHLRRLRYKINTEIYVSRCPVGTIYSVEEKPSVNPISAITVHGLQQDHTASPACSSHPWASIATIRTAKFSNLQWVNAKASVSRVLQNVFNGKETFQGWVFWGLGFFLFACGFVLVWIVLVGFFFKQSK